MVKIIISVFDLIPIGVAYQVFLRVGRAIKFGGSQLQNTRFPIPLSKPIELRWKPSAGIVRANQGSFTLRCVEEYWISTGTGRNRSRKMVHEQIWSVTRFLDHPFTFPRMEEIELRFDIDPGLPSTSLSADRPIFWELEIILDLPGLDFEECYLVPVYDSETDIA